MKEVHISSLSEVKSVFNSYSDNDQYYRVLKNSNSHSIGNVELAQPIIRQVNMTIKWKASTNGSLKLYTDLSFEEKKIAAHELKIFHAAFKKRVESFKNIPKGFADKIIQIPSLGSIYFDPSTSQVVIVNWGFLEDSFNPKEGIIETLIPARSNSILVRLKDTNGSPVERFNLKFRSQNETSNCITDKEGYARFGALLKGEEFTIENTEDDTEFISKNFTCDGRKEYLIEIDAVDNFTESVSPIEPSFSEPTKEDNLPHEEEEVLEEDLPVTFKFVNSFNRPIKHKVVSFVGSDGQSQNYTTNEQGQVSFVSSSSTIEYNIKRRGVEWSDEVNVENEKNHIVQLKPIYPWFWWLTILILLILLLCCLFFNCFCDTSATQKQAPIDNITKIEEERNLEIEEPEEIIKPCNSDNKSGGEGITENVHTLGHKNGVVQIAYNMLHIPDKLEVYYENDMVASTSEIVGNNKGFVGGNLSSGCCGVIQFYYTRNNDDFCRIVITGLDETKWNYSISCPE